MMLTKEGSSFVVKVSLGGGKNEMTDTAMTLISSFINSINAKKAGYDLNVYQRLNQHFIENPSQL